MKPETHNAELGGLIGHTNNRVSHKTIISCEVKGYEVILIQWCFYTSWCRTPLGRGIWSQIPTLIPLIIGSDTLAQSTELVYTKGWSIKLLKQPKIFFTEPYIIFRVKFSSKTLIQTWRNGFTQNTLRDAAKHLHLEYDSDYHQVSGKVVSGSHLYFDNANVIPLIQAL